MKLSEAIDLIGPAAGEPTGIWADFGAGQGLFSRALVRLLGDRGWVIAVDRDARALETLRRHAARDGQAIETAVGDIRELGRIDAIDGVRLAGAVFANALHFVDGPADVLERLHESLDPGGRVIVIEYDRETANRWVPYPLPPGRLRRVAERAGYGPPEIVARRPSAYHREIYCALLNG